MKTLVLFVIVLIGANAVCAAKGAQFEYESLWFQLYDEDMEWNYDVTEDGVLLISPPSGGRYTLENITVPGEVEYAGKKYRVEDIETWALGANPNLREITFESAVTNINKAITNCPKLEKVNLPENLEAFGGFLSCPKLTSIQLPRGIKRIYQEGLYNSGITSLVFPEGFEEIGYNSCQDLQLKELVFNGLKTVWEDAFNNAGRDLKVVKFPATLHYIGNGAFANNSFDELWFEGGSDGMVFGLDYAAFQNTEVKRIYCNSREVPSLSGPYHSHMMGDQKPYDPESGEEPWVFPFKCGATGINSLADLAKITLYVPEGCTEAYQAHHYWGKFTIEESDFQVGLAEVKDDTENLTVDCGAGTLTVKANTATTVQVYSMTGQMVASAQLTEGSPATFALPAGIYVVSAPGKSLKGAVH